MQPLKLCAQDLSLSTRTIDAETSNRPAVKASFLHFATSSQVSQRFTCQLAGRARDGRTPPIPSPTPPWGGVAQVIERSAGRARERARGASGRVGERGRGFAPGDKSGDAPAAAGQLGQPEALEGGEPGWGRPRLARRRAPGRAWRASSTAAAGAVSRASVGPSSCRELALVSSTKDEHAGRTTKAHEGIGTLLAGESGRGTCLRTT